MVFTAPNFTKPAHTLYTFLVYISCTEFCPNLSKAAGDRGKVSLTLLSRAWLSLHRISQNQHTLNTFFVYISCTEFCPNRSKAAADRGKVYLTPLSMTFTASIFTKPMLARQFFVKNSYTEFHENKMNGLVTDNQSQTKRRRGSRRKVFLSCFVKRA
jgi:hypothetical protein